jgi:hypothetical protein
MLRLFLMIIMSQSAAIGTAAQDAAESSEGAQTVPAAQTAQSTEESEPAPLRVIGRLPHCRPRAGDPLDSIDMAPAAAETRQQVIKRDSATGAWGIFPDDDPVTGPGIWQRAGTRMDQYLFRVPEDGSPMCIGARSNGPHGWGQLRQEVDARPYRGKIVRVTMWVASQKAGRIWFWVASGRQTKRKPGKTPGRADMATETGNLEFRGSHPWTPVSLTMGPVRCDQEKISFGVMLDGPGDLWIYKPELEVTGTQSAREAEKDCSKVRGKQ